MLKQCSKCRMHKEHSSFHKQSDKKDGLTSLCRECKKHTASIYASVPKITATTKICRLCKMEKSTVEFTKSKAKIDGLDIYCRSCLQLIHQKNNSTPKRKIKTRANHLKNKYNITLEDYDAMLESQNNCCAICLSTTPSGRGAYFHVDHDHTTGKIRALLCNSCNAALGYVKDSPGILRKMIAYLNLHR